MQCSITSTMRMCRSRYCDNSAGMSGAAFPGFRTFTAFLFQYPLDICRIYWYIISSEFGNDSLPYFRISATGHWRSWERATLAVWRSRVRIPYAPPRAFARFTVRYFSVTGGFFCLAARSFQRSKAFGRYTGIRPFHRPLLFSNGRLFLPRSPEFSKI